MKHKEPRKFLVIRFRQMGDAVLATSLLNTIKRNFPKSETHFVLNARIAPLFEGHPAVDKVISFSDDERHSPIKYLCKVWRIVHRGRYDVIIDMRSTVNTLLFAILSPFSRFRIGLRKPYTHIVLNYRIPECSSDIDVVTHDVSLLRPLEKIRHIEYYHEINLVITPPEYEKVRSAVVAHGVDLSRPVLLCGVVSKLAHKTWPYDYMMDVLRWLIAEFPDLQLIFNYAPGHEEQEARRMYEELGSPSNIYIDVQARTMRELVALAALSSGYFGNEGGARHIAHAVGRPSLVIVSPDVNKTNWLPQNGVFAVGISPSDVVPSDKLSGMSYEERYSVVTPGVVIPVLGVHLRRGFFASGRG